MTMINKYIYKTKIFPLWTIAVAIAFILVPLIRDFTPTLSYILIGIVSIYATSYITLRQLIFCRNKLYIFNLVHVPNRGIIRTFGYDEIYAIEIRNISAPYQLPYIIVHFDPSQLNSKMFMFRSGIFDDADNLTQLEEHLIACEVRLIKTL